MFRRFAASIMSVMFVNNSFAVSTNPLSAMEEVIVTAQKRKQNLQEVPLSISVLNDVQLKSLGITSLDGLVGSAIPSLLISPNPNSPSTLGVSIWGDGSADVVQPTRDPSVAIYLDGIYLGRNQGLSMELADLEQVEVLHGPQGTLFGRNSTSGAISIVSRKPTGRFGIKQTLGVGNYGSRRSVTRVNLPTVSGISAKMDYIHSERDGWVENSLAGQANFNEYKKEGGRVSLKWHATSNIDIDYAYDQSDIESAQVYFQLYEGAISGIGLENNRNSSTRFPLLLDPVKVDVTGQTLIGNWSISDSLKFRSLSGYRELDEDGFNNYGGTLGAGGLVIDENLEAVQYSQEFQLIGTHFGDRLNWATGLTYFKEDNDFSVQFLSSLDTNFDPRIPPLGGPPVTLTADAESTAIYGHGTWALDKRLDISIGLRFTEDDKSAARGGIQSQDIDSEKLDGSMSLSYSFGDDITAYVRWATAYKAGGYNIRSVTFQPFEEENNKTWELGVKSSSPDKRLTFSAAVFNSETKNKQFDFTDPNDVLSVETLNALKPSEITGLQVDVVAQLAERLVARLHYTYLDGDMPPQPNPTAPGVVETFELIQTPQHAGAVAIDYSLPQLAIGLINLHLDVSSTSNFAHATVPPPSQDAYTLVNAKISVESNLGPNQGEWSLSLWAKNLADEEYAALRFLVGTNTIQAFGPPRSVGVEATYKY